MNPIVGPLSCPVQWSCGDKRDGDRKQVHHHHHHHHHHQHHHNATITSTFTVSAVSGHFPQQVTWWEDRHLLRWGLRSVRANFPVAAWTITSCMLWNGPTVELKTEAGQIMGWSTASGSTWGLASGRAKTERRVMEEQTIISTWPARTFMSPRPHGPQQAGKLMQNENNGLPSLEYHLDPQAIPHHHGPWLHQCLNGDCRAGRPDDLLEQLQDGRAQCGRAGYWRSSQPWWHAWQLAGESPCVGKQSFNFWSVW